MNVCVCIQAPLNDHGLASNPQTKLSLKLKTELNDEQLRRALLYQGTTPAYSNCHVSCALARVELISPPSRRFQPRPWPFIHTRFTSSTGQGGPKLLAQPFSFDAALHLVLFRPWPIFFGKWQSCTLRTNPLPAQPINLFAVAGTPSALAVAFIACVSFFVFKASPRSTCGSRAEIGSKRLSIEGSRTKGNHIKTRWSPRTQTPTCMLTNRDNTYLSHFQLTHLWDALSSHTEAALV